MAIEPETILEAVVPETVVAPVVKAEPFKAFLTQADFDREIQKAVKANEANATKKAEAALEAKSLTESQKIQAQIDALNERQVAVDKKYAEVAAKEVLTSLGLEAKDYEPLLAGIVSTDVDETKIRADAMGKHILSIATSIATKKLQEQMKSVTVPEGSADNSTASTPEQKYNMLLAQAQKNPNDVKLRQAAFIAREALLN